MNAAPQLAQPEIDQRIGRRYVGVFLLEIEERLAKETFDTRDAFMLIHAFDHFVDALRLVARNSDDAELRGRVERYVQDMGAHPNSNGLKALRDVLAHYEAYVQGQGKLGSDVPFHPITINQPSGRKIIFREVGGLDLTAAAAEAQVIAALVLRRRSCWSVP